MSLRFLLFNIPKTLDEFMLLVDERGESVTMSLEEKAHTTPPDRARYFRRTVLKTKSLEFKLPWIPDGKYFGELLFGGADISRDGFPDEFNEIADTLTKEGIGFKMKSEPIVVFGLRKYI